MASRTSRKAAVGRSHRSSLGKEKLGKAIRDSKELLGVPGEYLLASCPLRHGGLSRRPCGRPSAETGDGARLESFSEGWATDVEKQLKLKPAILKANFERFPTWAGWTGAPMSCSWRTARRAA